MTPSIYKNSQIWHLECDNEKTLTVVPCFYNTITRRYQSFFHGVPLVCAPFVIPYINVITKLLPALCAEFAVQIFLWDLYGIVVV